MWRLRLNEGFYEDNQRMAFWLMEVRRNLLASQTPPLPSFQPQAISETSEEKYRFKRYSE